VTNVRAATKGGISTAYEVRPLSFAEVLDCGFQMVRDNFLLLVAIAAVMFIPWAVLQALGQHSVVFTTLGLIYLMLMGAIYQAAITIAVANVYLDRAVTIESAFRATRAILLPMIGTDLLMYLLLLLVALIPVLGIYAVRFIPQFLFFIALMIGVFYFAISWIFLPQVMIVEQHFGTRALGRSRALVRGSWWQVFGMAIAIGLISQLPVLIFSIAWSVIPFLGPLLTGAAHAITGAFAAAALTIYYFDRRCRVEDFDLIFLAQQIRGEAGVPPASPQSGSPSVA
jgi:hypothetical protein